MKLALFNQNKLGVVRDEQIYDICDVVSWDSSEPQRSLVELINKFDDVKETIEGALGERTPQAVADVKLQPPVPSPSKIVAAPVNYYLHQDEMNEQFANAEYTIENLGFFLKAPSSIIGPNDTIEIPFPERRTDHEAEVAFVISKRARNVSAADASEYIFGYFGLMDITVRGKEDRPWRKSFDTFTPIGPWIVTKDEIEDPNALAFELWVNDEKRQDANTKDLIYDCYKFLEVASHTMTLEPGDILTTGTPEGVGPITKGDTVRLKVERVGEFSVSVDFRK